MFIRSYVKPSFRALLAGCIICAGILTIGNALLFDRLFLSVLFLTLLLAIQAKDVDLIGVSLFLLSATILDEAFYLLPNDLWLNLIIYAVCGYVLYKIKDDKLAIRLAAPLLVFSIIVELYWLVIDYQTPQISYYHAVMLLSLLLRRLAFLRQFLMPEWFGKKSSSISLDYSIYRIAKYSALGCGAMLIEYLLRHLTNLNPLYIYYAYPYFQRALSVVMILLIVDYTYKQRFILNA